MTRIEKIRQMTDEELAVLLAKIDTADELGTCNDQICPSRETALNGDPCIECMLRFLRTEGPLLDEEGV